MLLPIDQFFPELTKMYRSTQGAAGTVWLTYKQRARRINHEITLSFSPHFIFFIFYADTLKDGKRIVLVRATDGDRKISLHLQPNEIKSFQDRYTAVLKHNVHKLKKRPAGDDAAPTKRAATTAKHGSAKKSSQSSAASTSSTASTSKKS